MVKIPRKVTKFGNSWVIVLDQQTRKILGGVYEGEIVYISKETSGDTNG